MFLLLLAFWVLACDLLGVVVFDLVLTLTCLCGLLIVGLSLCAY